MRQSADGPDRHARVFVIRIQYRRACAERLTPCASLTSVTTIEAVSVAVLNGRGCTVAICADFGACCALV